MSIKLKLSLAGILALAALIFIIAINNYTIQKLKTFNSVSLYISHVEAEMLVLRRNEKDFLARKLLKYHDSFNENFLKLNESVSLLSEYAAKASLDTQQITLLSDNFSNYHNKFNNLAVKWEQLGLTETEGIKGKLRAAVHAVEEDIKSLDDNQLRADMLQLRRNEKDFLLRLDLKYQLKFNQNMEIFKQSLLTSQHSQSVKQKLQVGIENYAVRFTELIKVMGNIGLSSKLGLQGEMRASVHASEVALQDLFKELDENISKEVGDLDNFVLMTNLLGLFLALVVGVTSWLIAKSIVNPLKKLSQTMLEAASNSDLTLRIDVHSEDEIGATGDSFNTMLDEFQQIINKVSSSSVLIATSSEEMTTVMAQSSQGQLEQREQTHHLSDSMTHMNVSMQSIASSALEASKAAAKTMSDSTTGREVVNTATTTINLLSEDIKIAADAIQRVESDSERIGGVLDVIRGIAEQTNLLALNAAIEAARAGEQGRGFAVVADEVRTLAGRTQESTQEIQGMVESLQAGSKEAVKLMNKSREQTSIGVEKTTDASSNFMNIVSGIQNISEMNNSIAHTSEEQSEVTAKVNTSVEIINRIVNESAEGSQQASQASADLAKLAHELQSLVEQFKV